MTDIGLWAIAEATPDRTAVIEPNGQAVSYAELAALADRYGRGLQALGLRPGATVAGMLPNSIEALALFFAAVQTGLYIVPVNWHLTAPEVAYILTDSGAAAFVAHERFADVAAEAAEGGRDRSRRPVRRWHRAGVRAADHARRGRLRAPRTRGRRAPR